MCVCECVNRFLISIYNVLDDKCLLIYQHNVTKVQNDRARHDEYLVD